MRIHVWLVSAALALVPSVGLASGGRDLDAGLHHMIQGDYHGAEPLLRQAIARDPNDGIAHLSLASTLRSLGRGDEAIGEYQQALRLLPSRDEKDRADALYGIALTRDDLGDPIQSAQAWNDYVQYARPYRNEQASVAIAREHLENAQRLAGLRVAPPGTQKAGR